MYNFLVIFSIVMTNKLSLFDKYFEHLIYDVFLFSADVNIVEWEGLSSNPSIFEIDYSFLKKRQDLFKEELIAKCFHPVRLLYYLEKYNYDIGEDSFFEP